MITVGKAKELVVNNSYKLGQIVVKLQSALGSILAEDIMAVIPLPSFTQSSMDGYAVNHQDLLEKDQIFEIQGESKAGETTLLKLEKGKVFRIFTGAPVPEGATAVVMQENVTKSGDKIQVHEFPLFENNNIRTIGHQIEKGAIALTKGNRIGVGGIGFLGGFGIREVPVYIKPKIAFLVTGDELVTANRELEFGQIYESNSIMLEAALKLEGIVDIKIGFVKDELDVVIKKLEELSEWADIVLTSGGISVGDDDFVGDALAAIGVEEIFYKIRQKPGKPLFFGRKRNKLFFALPGNPASSLVCFYEYVVPAIRKMCGRMDFNLTTFHLPSTNSYTFSGERDEFLKAFVKNGEVTLLFGQESFALRSFAIANAIVYLPNNKKNIAMNDLVEVHLLP